MCDEWTAQDDDAAAARGLNRREFTAAGMAAAIAGFVGTAASATTALSESAVSIVTPDGTADAFFVHPASGRHPGIVLWPDARDVLQGKDNTAEGQGVILAQ